MVNKPDKNEARLRRHRRVRGKISGTAERPRLDVFRSAKHIYAQIGFLKVHVFPYSRRAGTPAADFDEQIPEAEKTRRVHVMQQEADRVRTELIRSMLGTEDEVLLETPLSSTLFTGYTRLYIPVLVSAPGHKSGDIVRVKLAEWDGERCRTELMT